MSRAEFAKELVAYGSSFFRKFVISVLHHIFSRKLSPIIDDSTNFMQNKQKTCLNCEVNYSKLKVYVVRIVRKYKTDYRKAGFYSEI